MPDPKLSSEIGVVINELNLLMSSGRLSSQSLEVIKQAYKDEKSAKGSKAALIKVQQLIVTTPEVHTTSRVTTNPAEDRALPSTPHQGASPSGCVSHVDRRMRFVQHDRSTQVPTKRPGGAI